MRISPREHSHREGEGEGERDRERREEKRREEKRREEKRREEIERELRGLLQLTAYRNPIAIDGAGADGSTEGRWRSFYRVFDIFDITNKTTVSQIALADYISQLKSASYQ